MPKPRSLQINLSDTPYYHCISKCVRGAYLCGFDTTTGRDFQHRRGWIEQRLLKLAAIFAIDVCAYAVMSNHLHVVLHINAAKAKTWTAQEVLHRWHQLHQGSFLTKQYEQGTKAISFEQPQMQLAIETFRDRLCSVSWFMRELNEPIARWANAEDGCSGRFWQGRFKSQALLDEAALLTCMAYVDLNPVRAAMSSLPEESSFTSIKKRVGALKANKQPHALYPFVGGYRKNMPDGIPFYLKDYLSLVDQSGRILRTDKTGSVNPSIEPILQRLNINADTWLTLTHHFTQHSAVVISDESVCNHYCRVHHRQRRPSCLGRQKHISLQAA